MEIPLISGRDYPNTYRSFVEIFPDNASCAAYLIKLRRPNGFICPACKIATTPRQGSCGRLTCAVQTDGWSGYNGLAAHGFTRKIIVQSSSGDPVHVSMPGVHRVSSLLKRWILGTHQGSVVPEHLQSYLDEFTFRFNRRTSRSRGLVFRRLLERAVATGPVTENDLTHGYKWG